MRATDHIAQLARLFYGPGLTACRLNVAGNTQAVQGQEVIVLFSFCLMGDACLGFAGGHRSDYKEGSKEGRRNVMPAKHSAFTGLLLF